MWAIGKDETHQKFMSVPLNDRTDIPDALKNTAVSSADAPDTWCNGFCLNINHGFVPVRILPSQIVGIGQAPDNFGIYADKAKQDFMSHDYQVAFTNMGYASHFISDLGEPFHTPNVQLIPLQFINTPFSEIVFPNSEMILNYKALHDAHENMVADNWAHSIMAILSVTISMTQRIRRRCMQWLPGYLTTPLYMDVIGNLSKTQRIPII